MDPPLDIRGDGDPYAALGDVKDYFHCCGLPTGLSPYVSLPPATGARLLQAGILNIEGTPVPTYNVDIDNFSIFGQDKSQTDRIANQVYHAIESVGSRGHERAAATKWAITPGLEIDLLHSMGQGRRQTTW